MNYSNEKDLYKEFIENAIHGTEQYTSRYLHIYIIYLIDSESSSPVGFSDFGFRCFIFDAMAENLSDILLTLSEILLTAAIVD